MDRISEINIANLLIKQELHTSSFKNYENNLNIKLDCEENTMEITKEESQKELSLFNEECILQEKPRKCFVKLHPLPHKILTKYVRKIKENIIPTCKECNKTFISNKNLKTHEKSVHQNIKPHGCVVCNKKFSKPADLTRHIRIHTKEKPYICNQCNKSFSQNSTSQTHVKIVHLEQKLEFSRKSFFEK